MKKLSPTWLVLPFVLSVSACSVPLKEPTTHDFGSFPGTAYADKPDITVKAPKWLWENRIHYRQLYSEPTSVKSYTQDTWIAPPPELFAQQLMSTADTQHYALKIQLLDFEQQFDAPQQSSVVMRFNAQALSEDGKDVVSTKTVSLKLPAPSPDAAGAVTGFANITQQAVHEINVWIEQLSSGLKPMDGRK